jgi:uncharacterized protein (DUF302 family)
MSATALPQPSFGRTVALPYHDVLGRIEGALAEQGFGILTRIDVKATLKAKLGVDFPCYEILGACRPPLAHRALAAEPGVGVLLPCNVVVREIGAHETRVEIADPHAMIAMFPDADLRDVADEARRRLEAALAALP